MITIFENGKYILHLPDWANNVYLKLEELPYKEGLCVLEISYRDKKAYCLYHSVFFTTTLTAEEGSTFRAMKYNPGVIVECTEPSGRKTYSFHDQFVNTPSEDSLEELIVLLEGHLLILGETFEVTYTVWCKRWHMKAVYVPVGPTIIRG